MSSKSTFSNSTSKSYALALYELSKENSELDEVEDGMKSLNKLLNESSDFKEMISSPTITKEDKKNILFTIADQNNLSQILKKFLGFVVIKNRLFFLSKIIDSFLNFTQYDPGGINLIAKYEFQDFIPPNPVVDLDSYVKRDYPLYDFNQIK